MSNSCVPKIILQPWIIGFFVLGVLSSMAFRAIIIFQTLHPAWVRPVWYFAVCGYMIFFLYRYQISQRRKRVISKTNIIEKIGRGETLCDEDRSAALYLLTSIKKSREDWNYLTIFVFSALAIALDLLLLLR